MDLNQQVRAYWEKEPCGTGATVLDGAARHSREAFERVEEHRYAQEPFIHAVAQFTRHRGKKILEVGVGAGTDHLQFARAGCECFGVDLTQAAIDMTSERLAAYGLRSVLQRLDAEHLPFGDAEFDLVYSWGVIHHSEHPETILEQIHRVLRPGGSFVGMMYNRRSVAAVKVWMRDAAFKLRPWQSLSDVIWRNVESIGTKAYTARELERLLETSSFQRCEIIPLVTPYDTKGWPAVVSQFFPPAWGWFLGFRAAK